MGITIEQSEKTCKASEIPISGTIMFANSYFIKAGYEGEEDMIIVYIDLLTGQARDIASSIDVIPVELIMRKKPNG